MDKPEKIPSPPSSTDGIDGTEIETAISGSGFPKGPMVCPPCAKSQQESTNGASSDNKDGAAQSPSLSISKADSLDDPQKILETIVVSQVEAPHTGTIKIIELRRPHAKNALSRQMVRELGNEIEQIHQEAYDLGSDTHISRSSNGSPVTTTRALVLASAVDDVFCAGADLKERAAMSPPETRAFLAALRAVLHRLAALPVPAVACVAGAALGGGLELALACHLRVFARGGATAAALPEVARLAVVPGAGGTYRLPRVVGASRALDLILTGRRVGADEALAMGLCNRVVPVPEAANHDEEDGGVSVVGIGGTGSSRPETLQRLATLDAGIALAREATSGGPAAVRAALGVLSGDHDALENAAYEAVLCTEDRDEALQAFLEKRLPVFQGQ